MENTTDKRRTNGLELKLARVARGVSQRAIASQLGVSPQRVSAIEATYWPTATICKRYHLALASISGETPDAVGDEVRR
jgi:transcriptional regulator with XRE-family HTH domain